MNKNLLMLLLILVAPSLTLARDLPIYNEVKQQIIQTANQPEFVIQLNSNPSTGYSWFLRPCDPNYIKVIQHQYIASAKKGLIGAGGIEEWKFQLTKLAL